MKARTGNGPRDLLLRPDFLSEADRLIRTIHGALDLVLRGAAPWLLYEFSLRSAEVYSGKGKNVPAKRTGTEETSMQTSAVT